MKATGIVRRIDDLGRVVIPKELRRTMKLEDGDPLEIYVTGEEIVLKKYQPAGGCSLCGGLADRYLELSQDKRICAECGQKIIDKARL